MKADMIVFMGGQGSGKGTFSNLLLKQHDYNYVEAGALLRTMPIESVVGQKIAHGELINDEDLFPIMAEKIVLDKDIIIDGFPRTLGQAKWLIANYADKFNIRVVFLNISEEKMITHIKNRIKEGGNRADDNNENAVQKRLQNFKDITMPAIKWLSEQPNVKFYDVVLPYESIDDNFAYIVKTLN